MEIRWGPPFGPCRNSRMYRKIKCHAESLKLDIVGGCMSKELETWIERKLKGVHKNKIFLTKDGRYKTHNPQMIKTKKIDLLIALYEFYYHEKPEVNRTCRIWR